MITPFSADGTINQLPDGHPYLMASYTSPLHYATAMQKHLGASEPGASQAPPPPAVLEPEPEPGMAADPPTKELVADLCKIIENQTSEINTLRDSKPKALTHIATDDPGNATNIVPHQPVMVPAFAVGPNGIPMGPNGLPSPMVIAQVAGQKRKRDPNKPRKPRQPPQADDSGRTCTVCGTSTTPKWRCGMTLCNACGLRTSKKAQAAANRQAIATGMVDANGIPTVPATAIAAVMPPGGVPAAGEPSPDIAPVSTGFGAVSVPLEASLPVATEEVPTGCFPSTSFVPQ